MNFVEQNTWEHIQTHITRLDPDRRGWCVDAGVGDGDYYFEWFAGLGYKTLAIEPLLTEAARFALANHNILFIEAALADYEGEAQLHTTHSGIHSLKEGLFGDSEGAHTVPVHTWRYVIELIGIEHIAALKLDIEGSEGMIIRQLWDNPLPSVMSFEFGGVWQRASGRGQWSPQSMVELLINLRLLWRLGYREGVVISSGDSDRVMPITLGRRMDIEALFTPDCGWGNIVVWRGG